MVNERFAVEDCAASIRGTTQKSSTFHPADRYGQEIRINVDHRVLLIMKPMLLKEEDVTQFQKIMHKKGARMYSLVGNYIIESVDAISRDERDAP